MASLLRNLFHLGSSYTSRVIQIPTMGVKWTGYELPVLYQRLINTSAVLLAEPMKKKKKMDPAIIRAREEKKRRRLEKQIRRLEKFQRQLKPLDETEIPVAIIDNARQRARKLPQLPMEVSDARWKLVKEWAVYKNKQVEAETRFFQKMRQSQDTALEELRKESPFLYEECIKIDTDLITYEAKGPTETPPIENYNIIDGDYIDISRKWD